MAFSFDIKDAETNSSAVAHLHKCHGPRCKFMIRTYADWALEQARKAEGGEDFAFLSSFGQRHDDCKEQAKEIRAAERAELEAQEPASEPVPVAKVETPAVTPAPAAVTPEPVPTKVETSAPAVAPVMPATAPDPVVPMASAPVAASSEVAQVIMAVGSLLSGMKQTDVARILEALPKQKDVNVAEIMQAAAAISDKQTSKLGEVASASQAQLGRVIEKLLEDRTATVRAVDDIPRRVRAEIYGDVVDPRGMDEVYQQVRGSRPLSVERPSGE